MNYKVSIIIPIYNVEQYLLDCLQSVQAQTLDAVEVIAVNDGSTDRSLAILKEFCTGKENFKIIDQPNKGLSGARNAGLALATGEYIYFLDSDDMIAPTLCEVCYHAATQNALDLVFFDTSIKIEEGIPVEPWMISTNRTTLVRTDVISGQAQYNTLWDKKTYRVETWLYFIKKSFLASTGLTFKEGMIFEDTLFTPILFILAGRTKYLPLPLHIRRVRDGSIMMQTETYRHSNGYLLAAQGLLLFLETHQQLLRPHTISHLRQSIEHYLSNSARWCGRQTASAERTAFQKEIQAVGTMISWPMSWQMTCLLRRPVFYMKFFMVKETIWLAAKRRKKQRLDAKRNKNTSNC